MRLLALTRRETTVESFSTHSLREVLLLTYQDSSDGDARDVTE